MLNPPVDQILSKLFTAIARYFVSLSKNIAFFKDFGDLYVKAMVHLLFEMLNSEKIVSEFSVSKFSNRFRNKSFQTQTILSQSLLILSLLKGGY